MLARLLLAALNFFALLLERLQLVLHGAHLRHHLRLRRAFFEGRAGELAKVDAKLLKSGQRVTAELALEAFDVKGGLLLRDLALHVLVLAQTDGLFSRTALRLLGLLRRAGALHLLCDDCSRISLEHDWRSRNLLFVVLDRRRMAFNHRI